MAYERNLGKGYALRTGSAVARGRYVAWIDSDMDLDPAGLWDFLALARRDDLDTVVGSKRHPDSEVSYPARRRLIPGSTSSWCGRCSASMFATPRLG